MDNEISSCTTKLTNYTIYKDPLAELNQRILDSSNGFVVNKVNIFIQRTLNLIPPTSFCLLNNNVNTSDAIRYE